MNGEIKYCAFFDVLGYKDDIVLNKDINQVEKLRRLEAIFKAMSGTISGIVKSINNTLPNSLFIKSFSDSVYLESSNLNLLLFAFHNIFNNAIKYDYLFLLRAGIVVDWTEHFMDIASLINNPIDEVMRDENGNYNPEFYNVVGPGIARAYLTSENTGLKGMRIIISPEVLNSFNLIPYDEVAFECYYIDIKHPKTPLHKSDTTRLYFLPIYSSSLMLYEFCWTANFNKNLITELSNIEEITTKLETFCYKAEINKHYIETLKIVEKGLQINFTMPEHNLKEEAYATLKQRIQDKISQLSKGT